MPSHIERIAGLGHQADERRILHLTTMRDYTLETLERLFRIIDGASRTSLNMHGMVSFLTPTKDQEMSRKFFMATRRVGLDLFSENDILHLCEPTSAQAYVKEVVADGVRCVIIHDALENCVEAATKVAGNVPIIDSRMLTIFANRYHTDRSDRRTERQPQPLMPSTIEMCCALLKFALAP